MSSHVEPLRRRLDDRSFEHLYRRHLPEIYRYVLRDVGNRADAEEVTQNAFLDAYRALGRGHAPEKPRAWLFGIAKNATRRRYRTLSRRPHEVELDDEFTESVAEEEHPQLDELRDAVGSLRPAHQEVLFLREIEGLSYVEIANRMDLSQAAVETLLFRARRSLRGQLEEAGIRPAAAPVSRRRRLAGLAFLPAGLLRHLDRFSFEAERSGIVLKTAAAATAAVILGAGITVAVVPLGAAGEREQAVTLPKAITMPTDDATLFTSVFSASGNPTTDGAGAGATDSSQGSGAGPGGKDNDSVVQTFADEGTSLVGGSGVVQPGAIVPAVSIPSVTTPTVSIPSVTTSTVSIPSVTTSTVSIPSVTTPTVSIPSVTTPTPTVTAPALPQVDVPGLPDVPVTTSALPGLP